MPHQILDTRDAADFLGLSPHTLERWRWSGNGPRFLKMGKAVRYRRADLENYIERAARQNTSEASSHGECEAAH